VDVARAYLRAIERGDVETVLACYHPDAVQIDDMVAHSAIAFTFDNGKITSQRNYDCFDAF
jgi:ketosteroid isomerase-like protein